MFMTLRLISISVALCSFGFAECRLIGGSTFANDTATSSKNNKGEYTKGEPKGWKVMGDELGKSGSCYADKVRSVSPGTTASQEWDMKHVKYAYIFYGDQALFANQWKGSEWWLKIRPGDRVRVQGALRQANDAHGTNRYQFTAGQAWERR